MFGLALLLGFALYLAISLTVVILTAKWAKRHGRRGWLWGLVAALVMYNLVFWDALPTYLVYKYYAVSKAGFWVYKTPEQWKQENPGVAETLTWSAKGGNDYIGSGNLSGYRGYQLNERILRLRGRENNLFPGLDVNYSEYILVDSLKHDVLVRQVSATSGTRGYNMIKQIYNRRVFMPGYNQFIKFENEYERLGRELK